MEVVDTPDIGLAFEYSMQHYTIEVLSLVFPRHGCGRNHIVVSVREAINNSS